MSGQINPLPDFDPELKYGRVFISIRHPGAEEAKNISGDICGVQE